MNRPLLLGAKNTLESSVVIENIAPNTPRKLITIDPQSAAMSCTSRFDISVSNMIETTMFIVAYSLTKDNINITQRSNGILTIPVRGFLIEVSATLDELRRPTIILNIKSNHNFKYNAIINIVTTMIGGCAYITKY